MSRIVWISLLLGAVGLPALGQDKDYFMLDEVSIKGQVREPAVAIISSRLQPEIVGFKLEKSFFDQVRSPDEELVDVDPVMGQGLRIPNREALLNRARSLPQAAWPLRSQGSGAAPQDSDATKAATEDGSGH